MPYSASSPRIWLACAVRALTKPCRARCTLRIACCSTFLIGTVGMSGRVTASQIAAASAASFLFRLTNGLTYCGAINCTVWPSACSFLAQWWALPQASRPILQDGRLAKNAAICARLSCFFSTARPLSSAPCT
jgi:hypothetical protein